MIILSFNFLGDKRYHKVTWTGKRIWTRNLMGSLTPVNSSVVQTKCTYSEIHPRLFHRVLVDIFLLD